MINEKAQEHILSAIEMEKEAAISNRGYFHSDHEAWAVLKEEVEELTDACYKHLRSEKDEIDNLWSYIKLDRDLSPKELEIIRNNAYNIAFEAVQVIAMCLKWGESVEQREQEEG